MVLWNVVKSNFLLPLVVPFVEVAEGAILSF
jgi:hypothetical protein